MRITEKQLRRIVREEAVRTLVAEGRITRRAANDLLSEGSWWQNLTDTVGTFFGANTAAGRIGSYRDVSKDRTKGEQNLIQAKQIMSQKKIPFLPAAAAPLEDPKNKKLHGKNRLSGTELGIYSANAARMLDGKVPSGVTAPRGGIDRTTPGLEAAAALSAIGDNAGASAILAGKRDPKYSDAVSKGYAILADINAASAFLVSLASRTPEKLADELKDGKKIAQAAFDAQVAAAREANQLKAEAEARAAEYARDSKVRAGNRAAEEEARAQRNASSAPEDDAFMDKVRGGTRY